MKSGTETSKRIESRIIAFYFRVLVQKIVDKIIFEFYLKKIGNPKNDTEVATNYRVY
jgi:hypothetical protein